MARAAYVLLNATDGAEVKVYGATYLATALNAGYLAQREIYLEGTGRVLLVLERPTTQARKAKQPKKP